MSFVLLLLELFLFAGIAHAQVPFTILEKETIHLRSTDQWGAGDYVRISNELNQRIYLQAYINGDSNFRLSHTEFSFPHDSSRWALGVSYSGTPGDTSHAWVVIYHAGTGYKDSVEVWGYDLRVIDAYNVYGYDRYFGSYYWMDDSLRIIVQNTSASSIAVTATILSGAYGISLAGSNQVTIAPNAYGYFRFDFDSQNHDSAYARVQLSGGGEIDTFDLHARVLGDTLYWYYRQDYFDVTEGDTLCKTIKINNFTSKDAYIYHLDLAKGNDFYLNNGPSLPYFIEAGDSLELSVCYVPDSANTASNDFLSIGFQFPGQASRTTGVYLYGSSRECVVDATPTLLDYGRVDSGDTRYGFVWLHNRHGLSVWLDSISFGGDTRFSTEAPIPFRLIARDSARIDIRFVAGDGPDPAGHVTFYTGCGNVDVDLAAAVIDNDSAIALFGDQTHILRFTTDSSVTYRFYNDQQDSIKITSVSLAQGVHFTIAGIAPSMPEFTLAPNDEMLLTVELVGSPGNYDDTLVIVTESGFIALRFPIDADLQSNAVNEGAKEIELEITPNPAVGVIKISVTGGRATSIEVLDMLGVVIARLGSKDTAWDGSKSPRGTYFIRVVGVDELGRQVTVSRRIVLQ